MSDFNQKHEVRCPVHGFIPFSDWEHSIIEHPAFQRLRRIRQLAWTDQVYPGAMHTRFEHSLGVMHTATMLFDSIVRRSETILKGLDYTDNGLDKARVLVRVTALLHDVGHGPFSHASEEVFPFREDGITRYTHEDYSAAIIRGPLREVIEKHSTNRRNYSFTADYIAGFLERDPAALDNFFWRNLIDGQMDADRMDYLLRDSMHSGVGYGQFDLQHLIQSVALIPFSESKEEEPAEAGMRFGVNESGIHAAEALILARYFMFTQVYFHKTRVIYDYHLEEALKCMLPGGCFPTPDNFNDYLKWDDWRVLGRLANGEGGEHGRRLANRNHYREIYHTLETPTEEDTEKFDSVKAALENFHPVERSAAKGWYKPQIADAILVKISNPSAGVLPLSACSPIAKGLHPIRQKLLYVRPEDAEEARAKIKSLGEET